MTLTETHRAIVKAARAIANDAENLIVTANDASGQWSYSDRETIEAAGEMKRIRRHLVEIEKLLEDA